MIELALHQLLAGSEVITAIIDDRIYSEVADSSPVGTYLVTTVVAGDRGRNVDLTPKQKSAFIQIDAYTADAVELNVLVDTVIGVLDGNGFETDDHNIQVVLLRGEPRGNYEQNTGLRRKVMEFVFYYV